ncbi:amino acid adenylation domain-containing protein [Magnetovirga frankeli]|uniref:non-ribosomal peptide synthetase n=1 Tax=Magnetovirga frankeli TaxID=947516 RepID=UPI0012932C79|nr:amino acid adenylation domain-containing protein [gamma proteobacterium SS-5]
MSIDNWLHELYLLGIQLWREGDSLCYRIPKSQADRQAEILEQLGQRKAEVMAYLHSRALEQAPAAAVAQPLAGTEEPGADTERSLSFVQEQLWLLDQLEGQGSAAYSVPIAFRLLGPLDLERFRASLQGVMQRQQALRSRFPAYRGKPRLEIGEAQLQLELFDVSALPLEQGQALIRQRIEAAIAQPFDVQNGPLFCAQLHRCSQTEAVVLLNLHHIICDAWSIGILVSECCALYAGQREGQSASLPPLRLQYADYARWQRQQMQGEPFERGCRFWLELLQDAPPLLPLPLDRPRPAVKGWVGRTHRFYLDAPLSAQVKALSRAQDCTLFVSLLSAWYVLLARYSGVRDMVIGCPLAGRQQAETEPLIGFFINTLALRIQQPANLTFSALLQAVKQLSLEAFAHQDIPFETLVQRLQPERSLSHSPLFQVAFALQNAPLGQLEPLAGLRLEPYELEIKTAKFDLTLSLSQQGDRFEALLEYDSALFTATTVERIGGHYCALLQRLTQNPESDIYRLDYLGAEEKAWLLQQAQGKQMPLPDQTVLDQFQQIVDQYPQQIALVEGERQWTYGQLERLAQRLAQRLSRAGIRAQQPVGLYFDRCAAMPVTMLAVLKLGAYYVPLDSRQPRQRLSYMIQSARIRHIVCAEGLAGDLLGAWADERQVLGLELFPLDAEGVCQDQAPMPAPEPVPELNRDLDLDLTADDLVYAIFTSGSSGQPKCVGIPELGLRNLVHWQRTEFAADVGEHRLWISGSGFDASVWELWPALLSGSCIFIVPDQLSPQRLQAFIRQHGISSCFLPTPIGEALLALSWDQAGDQPCPLRRVFVGGDRLHDFAQDGLPFRLYNAYGPTENSVVSSCGPVPLASAPHPALPSLGRPIANTQIYVLDEYLQPVPQGVYGELCIAGVGLARGYLEQAGLTAERFVANFFAQQPGQRLYRTGDRGRLLENGELEFSGRLDRQVKLRGYRIELREIEVAIGALPGVGQVLVDLVRSSVGTEQLVAWIACAEPLDEAELRHALQGRLPEYMIPSHWLQLAQLPLNQRGKIDRARLPLPALDATDSALAAPQTPLQRQIAAIWAEVLGLEQVGIGQNFFALGGHSLLATQVVSRIGEACAVELPLKTLFEHPSIAALALQLERLQGVEFAPIRPLAAQDPQTERQTKPSLSYAQERLWFLHRLVPDSAFYLIPVFLKLKGPLHVQALEQAFAHLLQRHEALRTGFVDADGSPRLWVVPKADLSIRQLALDAEAGALDRQMQALLLEEMQRPFDLARPPLLRVSLIRCTALSDESHDLPQHLLLISLHHIIADGWSLGVMNRELSLLYNGLVRGEPVRLPPLAIQYADFAFWQRGFLSGARCQSQLDYWRAQLAGLEVLHIPTDFPRPEMASYAGARQGLGLSQALSERLKAFSQGQGLSLFMTLLSAFYLVLYRYSGQSDIALASPIANRNRREIEPLIGFFVNTLVLRVNLQGCAMVQDLLRQVRATTLQAFDHQDLPFEQIVQALKPVRDLSRNPLAQVLFALQNMALEPLQLDGLQVEELELDAPSVRMDMELHVFDSETGLQASLIYNRDLFSAERMAQLLDAWQQALELMLEDPERPLQGLELLSPARRDDLMRYWNGQPVAYPEIGGMHELFEQQVSLSPQAICLVFGQQQLSYAQLARRVQRLAAWFQAQGLGAEQLVGVCLPQSIERVVVALALHKAGAAFLPLDLRFPAERLGYMLGDAGIDRLIAFSAQEAQINALGLAPNRALELLKIDQIEPGLDDGLRFTPVAISPDQLAYVIYTSGSTGNPKGIAMGHGVITNMVRYQVKLSGAERPLRTLQFAPLIFDIVFQEMYATWQVGGTLVLASEEDRADPERLIRLLNEQRIERFFLPFVALQGLAESAPLYGLNTRYLQEIISAGEQLQISPEIRELLLQRPNCRLYNQYGPSECHVVSNYRLPAAVDDWARLPPIGRALDNVQIYLLDDALNRVLPGVVGEIYIGGACLARGYLHQPGLTAAAFVPNPFAEADHPGSRLYKTGDLAYYNPEGQLEFVGRRDAQVKIRGYRIELNEIELAAKSHPGVKQALVSVEQLGEGNRQLVLYLVFGSKATDTDSASVRKTLESWLPEYMLPNQIRVLERMPLTTGGKIDRKALPKVSDQGQAASPVALRTDVERRLATIWQKLLQRPTIGVGDHFFELGGNSLMAVRLMAAIQKEWQIQLPLAKLFQKPTLEALAVEITALCASGQTEASILVPLRLAPSGVGPGAGSGTGPGQCGKPPLFLIHAGSGTVFCYRDCAPHLDPSRPVYAIQSPGFVQGQQVPASVGQMAERYLSAIKQLQPQGPYYLGGWCQGGAIAFEMAHQLQQNGDQLGLLFLLNSFLPERQEGAGELTERDLLPIFVQNLLQFDSTRLPANVPQLISERQDPLAAILQLNQESGFLGEDYEEAEFRQRFQVFSSILKAILDYEPPQLQGDLLFFQAQEQIPGTSADLAQGWRSKISGQLHIQPIAGNHYSLMEGDNLAKWVRALDEWLEGSGKPRCG